MTATKVNDPVASEAMTSKEDKEHDPLAGCGILGRYPIISVITFATVGICVGIGK
jgi:hypothetical protein